MIEAADILKSLFILGIAGFVVLPQQSINLEFLSISGDLEYSFSKIFLAIVGLNVIYICFDLNDWNGIEEYLGDVLGVAEVVGLNFLYFLTPYVIQQWIHDWINTGDRLG